MKRTMTVVLALITMMSIITLAVPALANEYLPCGDEFTADLIADGGDTSTDVGNVYVSNNDTQVCVHIVIEADGWWITETHIEVAETLAGIPQNNKGTSAVPGNFEDEQYFDISVEQTHAEYCVVLEDIDDGVEAGDSLVVAAHAVVARVVCKKDGKACKVGSEGAWADGTPFSLLRGWDTYMDNMIIQGCYAPGPCPCFTEEQLFERSGDPYNLGTWGGVQSQATQVRFINAPMDEYFARRTDVGFYGYYPPECNGPYGHAIYTEGQISGEQAQACYDMLSDFID
jgi:hypothetical protein